MQQQQAELLSPHREQQLVHQSRPVKRQQQHQETRPMLLFHHRELQPAQPSQARKVMQQQREPQAVNLQPSVKRRCRHLAWLLVHPDHPAYQLLQLPEALLMPTFHPPAQLQTM